MPGRSDLVRKEGLEPTCLSALEPKSSASTNSATFAVVGLYPKTPPPGTAGSAPETRYNPENSSASSLPLPVDHYENFPVASWLLPPRWRSPIEAIYGFARRADDIADEGELPPAERLAQLERHLRALDAIESGRAPEPEFAAIARAVAEYALPVAPLRDLIDAFAQDVTRKRYATFGELMDYARRSANPIGRLLLHLFSWGKSPAVSPRDAQSGLAVRSDLICSALQLVNFWQDVAVDWRKGRVYIPQEDLERFGVGEEAIANGAADDRWAALMAFECARAREMLIAGAPLGRVLPGRLGLEIRATVGGGLAILDRIDAVRADVFRRRPVLTKLDWMKVIARAVTNTGVESSTARPR